MLAEDVEVVADACSQKEAERFGVVAEDVERRERFEPAGLANLDRVQLVRDASLGRLTYASLGDAAFLIVFALIMWRLAVWRLGKRLID